MIQTKEGSPLPTSAPLPPLALKPETPLLDLSFDNMNLFKKSPNELKADAIRLQRIADMMKSHWAFVGMSFGWLLFNYYKGYETTKTLNEIQRYVRIKK